MLFLLRLELISEPGHDAGDKSPAVSISFDPGFCLVLGPQTLGRHRDEVVNVVREIDVFRAPADFHHSTAYSVERPVAADPNDVDEKVILQNRPESPLGFTGSTGRATQTAVNEAVVTFGIELIEVVLKHESLCGLGRGLCFVLVGTLRQRQEFADLVQNRMARMRSICGRNFTRSSIVDPSRAANLPKHGTMRRFIDIAHHLVNVLVRHLVFEHFHHRSPTMSEEQPFGNLD